MSASGWRELRDVDDGGQPLTSGVDVALIAEELGRGLADVPFVGPILAGELCRMAGAPASGSIETVAFTADLLSPAAAVEAINTAAAAMVTDAVSVRSRRIIWTLQDQARGPAGLAAGGYRLADEHRSTDRPRR